MSNADINMRFERIARTVANILADRRGLPAPNQISICRRNEVQTCDVQFHAWQLTDLAVWAKAMGAPIRMVDKGNYVRVSATQTVNDDIEFEVWGHMTHSDAWLLVSKHGKALTPAGVDLSPDDVLADLRAMAGGV